MEEIVTISRVINAPSVDQKHSIAEFLYQLRTIVRQARQDHAELKERELYDIGLVRQGEKIKVKLYFAKSSSLNIKG